MYNGVEAVRTTRLQVPTQLQYPSPAVRSGTGTNDDQDGGLAEKGPNYKAKAKDGSAAPETLLVVSTSQQKKG